MKLKLEHIVILMLLILLVFLQQCGGKLGIVRNSIDYTEVIKYDTTTVTHTDSFVVSNTDSVFFPRFVYFDTGRVDTVIQKMTPEDHLDALRDYFSVKVYIDTFKGQNYAVIVKDSVSRNSIIGRKLFANVQEKIITKEITKYPPPKMKFYIGAGIDLNTQNNTFDFTPSIMFVPRNDNFAYSMGYNVVNKGFSTTFYYKIRFK